MSTSIHTMDESADSVGQGAAPCGALRLDPEGAQPLEVRRDEPIVGAQRMGRREEPQRVRQIACEHRFDAPLDQHLEGDRARRVRRLLLRVAAAPRRQSTRSPRRRDRRVHDRRRSDRRGGLAERGRAPGEWRQRAEGRAALQRRRRERSARPRGVSVPPTPSSRPERWRRLERSGGGGFELRRGRLERGMRRRRAAGLGDRQRERRRIRPHMGRGERTALSLRRAPFVSKRERIDRRGTCLVLHVPTPPPIAPLVRDHLFMASGIDVLLRTPRKPATPPCVQGERRCGLPPRPA